MKRPRLKRRRPVAVKLPSVDEFLAINPLPAELAEFEPLMRSPFGQNLLNTVAGCVAAGFSITRMEEIIDEVIAFFTQEYHRCNACLNWTDESTAGGLVIDGRFIITAICPRCAKLAATGRATPAMERNVAELLFGGTR